MIRIDDFDYQLPGDFIAQKPKIPRDSCKLLVFDRKSGVIKHHVFRDIVKYLDKNDVLFVNRSKVMAARLLGRKESGGRAEVLLLKKLGESKWEALVKNLRVGQVMMIEGKQIEVLKKEGKVAEVMVDFDDKFIDKYGRMPLPPYIKSCGFESQYQPVYAREKGSSAAPTAGLHFTKRLLTEIKNQGVAVEEVVLHVGLGTFAQVTEDNVKSKKLHQESFEIETEVWQRLGKYKREGRRIVAVGTTSLRTLESGKRRGETSIFIYPPYKFKMVDSLITNFHLPKSSLLMLVAAMVGDEWKRIYREAVEKKYRFYSFGDAMWII